MCGGPCGTREGCGGIIAERKLACPTTPHPKCVAVCTCHVSVLGRVIDSDEHGILYGPGDTLGLLFHNGEIVQFDGIIHGGAGMDMYKGQGS